MVHSKASSENMASLLTSPSSLSLEQTETNTPQADTPPSSTYPSSVYSDEDVSCTNPSIQSSKSLDLAQIFQWNAKCPDLVDQLAHDLISSQAKQRPQDLAIDAWDAQITYHELDIFSSALAQRLLLLGAEPDSIIPFCFEKSAWSVVAMLAILKAGAAFVPLDPMHPPNRLRGIVDRLQPTILLTSPTNFEKVSSLAPNIVQVSQSEVENLLSVASDSTELSSTVAPSNLAYVIFTSGSTGTPKGVLIEHQSLATSCLTLGKFMGSRPHSKMLQFSSLTFDASILEIFPTLFYGGCICIPSDAERTDNLVEYINSHKIDMVFLTPSVAGLLDPRSIPSVRTLTTGGEAFSGDTLKSWLENRIVFNAYGPSEITIACNMTQLTPEMSSKCIGHAISSVSWIVDPDDHNILLPIGDVGELLVQGHTVARGYYKDEQKTAEVFIDAPTWYESIDADAPKKFYKTGDLVRYDSDGSVIYVGRKDSQIKVRGQRVELGEIEHHLSSNDMVSQALVFFPSSGRLRGQIIGVVVLVDNSKPNFDGEIKLLDETAKTEEIIASLSKLLPKYMIPSWLLAVESLPLLPSGKINKRLLNDWLVEIGDQILASDALLAEPLESSDSISPTTLSLQHIIGQVLNLPQSLVNLDKPFLTLGGDSISAMQVVSYCKTQGMTLKTRDVLNSSSISEMASYITSSQIGGVVNQEETEENFDLSPVQAMYFSLAPDGDNEFNQGFLLKVNDNVDISDLNMGIKAIVQRHSMLRARFLRDGDKWVQRIEKDLESSFLLREYKVPDWNVTENSFPDGENLVSMETGPLLVADIVQTETSGVFLRLIAHHLVIDLVSWRIILHDLEAFLSHGSLPLEKPLGFQTWLRLQDNLTSKELLPATLQRYEPTPTDLRYWGIEDLKSLAIEKETRYVTLDIDTTNEIMTGCHSALGTNPVDIMLSAVHFSFQSSFKDRSPPNIFDEGHGRNLGDGSIDLSQTVGWFTVLYPILVAQAQNSTIIDIIKRIKDFRRTLAGHEVSFFANKIIGKRTSEQIAQNFPLEILFNFFGQYQQLEKSDALLQQVPHGITENMGSKCAPLALFEISAQIERSQLRFAFTYDKGLAHQDEIQEWITEFPRTLDMAIDALRKINFEYTLADFPLLSLDYESLNALVNDRLPKLGLNVPNDIEDIYPCTGMQEGILASQTKNPSLYRSCIRWQIIADAGNRTDLDALKRAWNQVVRRHSALRTIFISSVGNETLFDQVVLKDKFPEAHLVSCAETEVFQQTSTQIGKQGRPLYEHEFTIYSTGSEKTSCQLAINHALFDGTSVQVVTKDLALAYRNELSQKITPSYKEYVRFLSQTSHAEHQSYWDNYLAESAVCQFPIYEGEQTDQAETTVSLESTLIDQIREFCIRKNVTLASIFQLAWALILRNLTDSDSVCFGCLTSGRDVPVEGIQDAVGAYMNMLVCRFDIQETALLIDVLEKSTQDFRQSLEHQNISLADIHRGLDLQGGHLFNTAISFQRPSSENILFDNGLHIEELIDQDPSEYDMTLNIRDSPQAVEIHLRYWKPRIQNEQAQNVSDMLARALTLIVNDPSKIISNLNLSTVQNDKFFKWNANLPAPTERCLHDIFQSVARETPNKQAVYAWDGTLSYSELDNLSSVLAEKLVTLGVGPEVLVPVCFEKSLWAIVAQLGILKAGGAFVPIDPAHPPQRHLKILADVKANLVLGSAATTVKLAEYIPNVFEVSKRTIDDSQVSTQFGNRDRVVTPSNVAYVIFTSGSTGNPKGVVIEHRAVSSSCTEHAAPMGFVASSRVLQFSSYTFDAAVAEIFTTLIKGGTVCVPSEKQRMGDIVTFINKADINWVFSTPSFIRTVDPVTVPKLKTLAVGGEIVGQDILATWIPHVTFIHVYGPTECCIFSLSHTVNKDEGHRVVLGRSFGSVSWIVDQNNPDKLSPLGAVGELLIQGPILGRGYLNEPEKTKAAFINSPEWLPGTPQKMYRTGDLVRYNSDGSLMYIGRKDNQVKLRGQRLELGEIEYNMSLNQPQHTAVAVELVDRAGMEDSKALAAFVCDNAASTEAIPDNDLFDPMTSEFRIRMTDLRNELYKCLPPYMVPSIYIHLKKMPPTPTGKLNRPLLKTLVRNLSQEDQALYSLMTDEAKTQPSTPLEKKMQKFWADILKMETSKIGIDDNFFHLGGDSIAALKLVSLARSEKLLIEVAEIFKNPSLKQMSLAVKTNEVAAPAPLKPFALLMRNVIEQSATLCDVEAKDIVDAYPCTPLQEGLLALSDKQKGAYVSNFIFRLPMHINIDRFKSAWALAVETTPILRTRIVAIDNWPTLQIVISETLQWKTSTSLQDYLLEAENLPFKMGLPLSHYALIHEGKERYFVMTAHHSTYDGWSLPLLFRKVESIYHQNQTESLHAPIDGFGNFIQHITNVDETQSRKFWSELLVGAKQLNFPQYPTPEYTPVAGESLSHSIKFGSQSKDFTTATIIQGAWAIVLGLHGESTDVTFGSVISGRNSAVPGISELIGPTVSTVPVRVSLDRNQSIRTFLSRLQDQSTERIPFEQAGLQNIIKLGPDAAAACQFQNLLVIQPLDVQKVTILGSEQIESNDVNARSVPLTLECNLGQTRLEITAHYDSNLIEKSKMDVIIHQFEHLFLELSSKHGRLIREIPLCSDYEKGLIRDWNKDIPVALNTCVHHLFKKQVIAQPDAPAVHAWDFQLTYSELDRYATAFAHYLVSLGVGPEVWVPVVMDKSAWTIVAMVGIIKAGGACAALDPSHPSGRLSGIIEDLEARILVVSPQYENRFAGLNIAVDKTFLDSLPTQTEDPETSITYTNAAVAIFTSGSTGKPKGIVIEHAHLCTSSEAHGSAQGVGPGTRVFSFASYAFDVSLGDTWTPIMRGACICVPSETDRLNNLAQTITEMRTNWLAMTPTVSRLLTPDMIPTVKTLTLGGEAIGKDDVATWADHLRVIGFYGPAETVIGAMMSDLSLDRTLNPRTLGHGLDANLWVVEPDNQDLLVPVGTIGELLIQGPAISRGYLRDPERTKKSYLTTNPGFLTEADFGVGHNQKIFKTGDLVYQNPKDGALIYAGRKDTQVKLHGQRIELQEIEEQLVLNSMGDLTSVAWAVELIQPGGPETAFLAAFFANNETAIKTGTNIQAVDILPITSELRELLLSVKKLIASLVPVYMVPSVFIPLAKMPLNTSGKTDRGQLRLLGKGLAIKGDYASYSLNEKLSKPKTTHKSIVSPVNSKELKIQKLWSKSLSLPLESISSTDDFFNLGGNSVTAMRLAAAARAEGLSLSVHDIFKHSSLADMASNAKSVLESKEDSTGLKSVRRKVAEFGLEAEDVAQVTDYQAWAISHGLTKHKGFYNDLFFEFDGAIDAKRLREACIALVLHNPVLKSAFLAHKGRLMLVNPKESSFSVDFQQFTWDHETATAAPKAWEEQALRLGKPPVKFALIEKSPTTHRLVLRISHAQYDGLSLPSMLEDLRAAYLGKAMVSRPSFFDFLHDNEHRDNTIHLDYWRELLENAPLTQIVQHKSLLHKGTMDSHVQQAIRTPSIPRTGTNVTNATIFKAAWALALSKLSGNDDVVFGHIIAGRSGSDNDYTSVIGACLNITPIRVRTTPNQTSTALLTSLHNQGIASIPHEVVGFKTISKACTSWPQWQNFSSILQHQNLDSEKKSIGFGESTCSFSGGVARVGAAADVWILTIPKGEETDVQLHFSSLIPREMAQEMLELFCIATDALCDEGLKDASVNQLITNEVSVKIPFAPEDSDTAPEPTRNELIQDESILSQDSTESNRLHQIVSEVWHEAGLTNGVGNDLFPLNKSFLEGDLVTAGIMADIYQRKGYNVEVEDLNGCETMRGQMKILRRD